MSCNVQSVQRIRDNRRIISVEIASVIHRSWFRWCRHGLAFTQILLLWYNEKTCGSWKKNVHKNKTRLPNVKFTIEQAMKAQRGVKVYVCSFFNLGAIWGEWSSPRSDRFTPLKQTQYPLYSKICGSQGRSGWLRKISPHRNSILW